MSENENQVSGQEDVSQEQPTPKFTPTSDSVPSDVEAIVERAMAKRMDALKRELQSEKDKRFSQIEKQLEPALPVLKQLQERGVNIPNEVLREMEWEDRIKQLEARSSGKDTQGSMSSGDAVESAKEILSEAGISLDDPEVVKLWQGRTYTGDIAGYKEMLKDVTRIATKRGKAAPTAAQSATPPGPVARPPANEELTNQYIQDMIAARGNRNAVLATKQKYKELGVPVDNVTFS